MLFSELNLIKPILQSLEKKGYKNPTPIQQKAIPHILNGRDVLGSAQTGTGKTAAFAIPTLQLLSQEKEATNVSRVIKNLILTPTRELAIQIQENLVDYGSNLWLRHAVIFGGVKQGPQVRKLEAGVDILVATPGRLLDLMNQGYVCLKNVEIFTLDEADRMLNMGFINDVKKVLRKLPTQKQTLFFSATMPKEIAGLADSILNNPVKIEVTPVSSTADTVTQSIYFVNKLNKKDLLENILKASDLPSVLVFSRTKHWADRIVKNLERAKITAAAIHGNKSQNARQRALKAFKNQELRVLVATDIAARWIDVDNLSFVINYDVPNEPETYIHRIGRTGRAGKHGKAVSFCEQDEYSYLKDIQKLIGKQIQVIEGHAYEITIDKNHKNPPRKQNKPRRHFSEKRPSNPGGKRNVRRNRSKRG